jgi:hypothetical protein
MRQGQQSRRGRNRGGRKPQNAMSRNYESSGPDVKIRGTAMHIAEKYSSLARDAMSSGDTVAAENYLQHAEHYNRIIMAAQAQNVGVPGMEGQSGFNGSGRYNQSEPFQRDYDGDSDDGEQEDFIPPQRSFPERTTYNQHQQPQPYIPQNAFPQIQPQPLPQPVVAPVPNGAQPVSGEPYVPPKGQPAEVDRIPRRRRRRPIGETEPKTFNGRSGNGSSAQGPSGAPQPSESKSDETAS